MRNISFSLTTEQFKARTKTVTRRLGWLFLKEGDVLMGCEKCQGIKKGEKINRLGRIRVVSVSRERVDTMEDAHYGKDEARKEGFPEMDGTQFIFMFCRHMFCHPSDRVTRIEFEYLDEE